MTTQALADRLHAWLEGQYFAAEEDADLFFAQVYVALSDLAWREVDAQEAGDG